MQEVLISIQPQWVEKILNGEKTIEIRKTMPKCEFPCKVYIYCTKPKKWYAFSSWGCTSDELLWKTKDKVKMCNGFGAWDEDAEKLNGKVVAEFTLNGVVKFNIESIMFLGKQQELMQKSKLGGLSLRKYLGNGVGYAWGIDNLKIYDKPKELKEFASAKAKNYDDWLYAIYSGHRGARCNYNSYLNAFSLKKAPQSWCYVRGRI